jgi:hypothetical protein
MAGVFRALAWAGLVIAAAVLFLDRTATAAVACGVIAAASGTMLLFARRRRRSLFGSLPPALKRLAYRSDETAVAFAWQWRRRRGGRLRILRSDACGTSDPNDTSMEGQTCVYDGAGDQLVDRDILPRAAYHYSIFAQDGAGHWSMPVHQEVLTMSPADRAAIEATLMQPDEDVAYAARRDVLATSITPDPLADPHGLVQSRGGAYIISDAVSGLATDALFAVADVFTRDKPDDGWEEIW